MGKVIFGLHSEEGEAGEDYSGDYDGFENNFTVVETGDYGDGVGFETGEKGQEVVVCWVAFTFPVASKLY